MRKSARNTIITAAVVAVVAVAAAPFVIKGLKKDNQVAVDASVSETAAAQGFTEAAQNAEETTADIVDEILQTIDEQQPVAAQQDTTASQYNNYTTSSGSQNSQSSYTPAATTARQSGGTQAPATTAKQKETTTSKPKKEKTTKETTTQKEADVSNGNMNEVSGMEALSQNGVVSYMWNPEGNFYYVEDNPWQRQFGFNVVYDWAAAAVNIFYDTWRACFDYDNLEWMIQAWKGQYGFLFIGGEIGVYTREPGVSLATSTHYNCADDNHLINMEMSVWFDAHDGNGFKKLFTRSYYPHWWSTGFVDGHLADYKFNDRSCLIQEARLTMYDDEMLEAFTTALAGCGFTQIDSRPGISNPDTFYVNGLDVYYVWQHIDQGYKTR